MSGPVESINQRRPIKLGLNELAGSMGDFGTLLPLAIGYIAVCGLDPAGFLVMMGLANIIAGLVFRLPMPIEPMKALAVVAIAQQWSPSMVYASGFGMGLVWLLLAATGLIGWIARITPHSVVRGIQVTLGILLAIEALRLGSTSWAFAILGVVIVLTLRQNRYAPAAIVLVLLGLGIMLFKGDFTGIASPGLRLPHFTTFSAGQVWQTLLLAGFAQVPLTATNAVISTSSLIKRYWTDENVSVRTLSWSHGIMNSTAPFLGGMPMCHGAGGLAGQYYYGARTAGANLIEGTLEIAMGLFLAASIAGVFVAFPQAIIGAMMFMVGIELIKFAKDVEIGVEMLALAATVAVSLLTNMAIGYVSGLAVYWLITWAGRRRAGLV
ncbi:MAG: putative sulfate/molybdate transporter [Anaerosomatales bacterium]|nr:putative sulfate/molybdate transporter [Coriobacteriia bacterium]MDF1542871.1 putative sulfate/molybdate transporter [Anaerosomatales bacterium]MDT8434334.1 putative sulfate/molybdate transporter [Anaerosomatales bacterium]